MPEKKQPITIIKNKQKKNHACILETEMRRHGVVSRIMQDSRPLCSSKGATKAADINGFLT